MKILEMKTRTNSKNGDLHSKLVGSAWKMISDKALRSDKVGFV